MPLQVLKYYSLIFRQCPAKLGLRLLSFPASQRSEKGRGKRIEQSPKVGRAKRWRAVVFIVYKIISLLGFIPSKLMIFH